MLEIKNNQLLLRIKDLFLPIFKGLKIDANPQPQFTNDSPCYGYLWITEVQRIGRKVGVVPSKINIGGVNNSFEGLYKVEGELRIQYNEGCAYNNVGYIQTTVNRAEKTSPQLFKDVLTILNTRRVNDELVVEFWCFTTLIDDNNVMAEGEIKQALVDAEQII